MTLEIRGVPVVPIVSAIFIYVIVRNAELKNDAIV